MALAQSIRSSTKWLLAGSTGGQLLSFAFGIVLARLLVPEDFGLLVTVQIFTGVAGLIAGGGMGQALVRSKDATDRDFNVVFTLQFGICLLIYAFFFLISPYFARWYDQPLYESLLRVTALNFLLRPLVGNHSVWLHRNMRFKVGAIIGFTSGLATSLTAVYMAWIGLGVWSLALSGIIGSLVNWALLSHQTPLRIRFVLDKGIARRVGGTGIKFSLLDIVSYLRRQANNFIISTMVGPAAVGLFNKADSLAKLPFSTLSSAAYDPVFRTLSKEQDNLDKSKYIFFRTATLLFAYTLPAYVMLSWLAKPFITVVYGQNWAEAAAPLSILAWLWAFSCLNHPAGALLAAQNRLGQELGQQFATLILNMVACFIGLRWGLTGVAWGLVIVGFFSHIYMMCLVKMCFPVRLKDFLSAVRPGFVLALITLSALGAVHLSTTSEFRSDHQPMFLGLSLAVGGFAYLLGLLYLPLAGLETESLRWRRTLRLAVHDVGEGQ